MVVDGTVVEYVVWYWYMVVRGSTSYALRGSRWNITVSLRFASLKAYSEICS